MMDAPLPEDLLRLLLEFSRQEADGHFRLENAQSFPGVQAVPVRRRMAEQNESDLATMRITEKESPLAAASRPDPKTLELEMLAQQLTNGGRIIDNQNTPASDGEAGFRGLFKPVEHSHFPR